MKLNETLRILLATFLVLVIGLPLSAEITSTVTLDMKNQPLVKVLKSIEQQTPCRFSYKSTMLDKVKSVTVKCENTNVLKALDQALAGTPLTYEEVSPKSIVIVERTKSTSKSTSSKTVTGRIVDENGEPLIGVTVMVGNSGKGVATDIDGNFTVEAAPGESLKVSYIGYDNKDIKIGSKTNLNISLNPNSELLDEMVVIGYGTQERKRVTSAITTIKGDDIPKGLNGATIATALKGAVTGLDVGGYNGPNSGQNFQLRGVASINSSQGPLIVVDGVPGGSLYSVNPEEIESIDVLKDASAGAIYGTRAAAGVILITTKRGQAGRTHVTYNCEVTVDHMRKRPHMLSAEEYVSEGIGTDYGYDTDWYGEMTQKNAVSQKHIVTLNGGTENARVFASLAYEDMNAVFKHDTRTDYSARINADFKAMDGILEFAARLQVRQKDADWRTGVGQLRSALVLNPTIPVMSPSNPDNYNVDESGLSYYTSPVADNEYRTYLYRQHYLLGTGVIKANLMKGLSIQGTANIDYRPSRYYQWYDPRHKDCVTDGYNGWSRHDYGETTSKTFEAYANFNRTFDQHHIDAVGGWSYYEYSGLDFYAINADFSVEGVEGWNLGEGKWITIDPKGKVGSSKSVRQRLLSYFFRGNYSFDDKYMVSASFRREGSSKFGPKNRWGNFWSLSGGWRINRENFMKDIDWINDLKIRVGYGVTGNNGLPNGISTPTFRTYENYIIDGKWQTAYTPSANVNLAIKWEEKKEWNVGFDFSLFNDRLWGRFDWYDRTVDDLIYNTTAPIPPYIYSSVYTNVGQLTNTGVELELGGTILQTGDWKWTSAFRLSHNTSKLKKIADDVDYIDGTAFPTPGSPGPGQRITSNSPIGQFWLFRYAGIDDDGKWMIYDKDNNIVPAAGNDVEANRIYKGNGIPKAILAMDHNVSWKGFDLGIQLRSWLGFNVYNQQAMYYGIPNLSQENVLRESYYRLKHIKDDNKYVTDFFLENGDFLKIEYITLGYTFNIKKHFKYIDKVRLYLTMRDVAMFTKYKGYNPEIDITGLFPAIESTTRLYPQTTRYTVGLQVNF
ncbi:MAG: SusC/RagA family TonB-linked outer membrane protein [Muribaculaceae bacterium]|nr:SusC/RagA family TonB-linked outer membrane protein [Muribaculaceae bacterium]